MKRGLAGLAVVVAMLLLPVRSAEAASIQPGDWMQSGSKSCTLGFVATSGADTFFLTAAHCVEAAATVELADGTVLGDVVAEGDASEVPPEAASDWALIRVRPHLVASVVGAVRGTGGAPSGVALHGETGFGDLIKHSGYGVGFDVINITREQRVGILVDQTERAWASIGPDVYGDSGGPVVHLSSGKALGLVSRLCVGNCTSSGPTIEGIFEQAALAGYPLTLRTA